MDLFDYPNAPGFKARDTAAAAAESMAEPSKLLRARALAVLERSNGLTADEVAGRMGASILSVRPRITELARLGEIRDSGDRRANASGRRAIVWAAINPARLRRADPPSPHSAPEPPPGLAGAEGTPAALPPRPGCHPSQGARP